MPKHTNISFISFFLCMSYTETLQSQILCDVAHIYKNKILTIRKQFCTNIFDYSCPKLPLMQEIVRAKIQWLKGFV